MIREKKRFLKIKAKHVIPLILIGVVTFSLAFEVYSKKPPESIQKLGEWTFKSIFDETTDKLYSIDNKADYYKGFRCNSNMLVFEFKADNTFELIRAGAEVWRGSYAESQKEETSKKDNMSIINSTDTITLTFTETKKAMGVFSKINDKDNKAVEIFVLSVKGKIVTFVKVNKEN